MDIAILAPRLAALPDDVQQRMARVRQALGSAIELSRRITEELHPTLLDNVGLFAALRWQLKNACGRTKINCIDDLPSVEPRLTTRASIALFRSAQEALVIGLEREAVTSVQLSGTIDEDALSIQVKGDGANLMDEPQNLNTLTLESIRHRIRALGGVVNVARPESAASSWRSARPSRRSQRPRAPAPETECTTSVVSHSPGSLSESGASCVRCLRTRSRNNRQPSVVFFNRCGIVSKFFACAAQMGLLFFYH